MSKSSCVDKPFQDDDHIYGDDWSSDDDDIYHGKLLLVYKFFFPLFPSLVTSYHVQLLKNHVNVGIMILVPVVLISSYYSQMLTLNLLSGRCRKPTVILGICFFCNFFFRKKAMQKFTKYSYFQDGN